MTTNISMDVWTEVEAISDQVRRALECPICLLLAPKMTCLCPNGHAVCRSCVCELWNRNIMRHCPVCRSPMVADLDEWSVTAVKAAEIIAAVRLTCTYRKFGCNAMYFVRDVTEHERVCAYKPNVRCLVSACQWLGTYEQLQEHVGRVHPNVYIKTPKNSLCVENINLIASNRRRMYLVHSPSGLFWVVLSRLSRSRIRAGVFVVEPGKPPETADATDTGTSRPAAEQTPQFNFRVTCSDPKNRFTNNPVGLSSKLNENLRGDYTGAVDPSYTVIRSKAGCVKFSWFPYPIATNL